MSPLRHGAACVGRTQGWAAVLLTALALAASPSQALVPVQAQTAAPATVTLAKPTPVKARAAQPAGSGWVGLTPLQQQSLAPLAGTWNSLSLAHQRKWLALSQNFSRLSPADQQVLHSRMRDWAALSTRQRAQARLNFGEAKQLSADEKKALWEAYQALPPEEKKKLAAGAQAKPPTTAAAVKPVAKQKLARVPQPAPDARSPRIAIGPASEDAADAPSGRAAPAQPAH